MGGLVIRGFGAALLGLCLSSGAVYGEPLKIGVLTDMSGVIADTVGRGSVVAAELAVSDAGHSVLGRSIEIVSADHQLKPDVGLTIARRWFDEEHVEAIADVPVSTIALGIQNLAHTKGKIALISGSGTLDLFGKACSPTGFVWTFDTTVLPRATVLSAAQAGVKKWFAVGPDYSFGHQMERAVAETVSETGGQMLGSRRAAIGTSDYASLLLAAQEAHPDAIASSFAGHDGVLLIENAVEFGLLQKGIRIAGLMLFESDVHSLGLDRMQGIYTTTAFYWDTDDNTRSFAKRFAEKMGRPPSALQAGVYSSIMHYLKAVKAAGTTSGPEVAKKMRELPISDLTTPLARIRADGRVMRDMFLVQVKSPSESKGPWDYFKIVRRMKPDELMTEAANPDCRLEK